MGTYRKALTRLWSRIESLLWAPGLRQTGSVEVIQPAADADSARWLLQPEVSWQDLVTFGPPGFAAYLRVALAPADGSTASDDELPLDTVGAALAALASHTTTPDRGYAAVWEGWGGGPPSPLAPRVPIPNREMLLFTGRVESLRDAPAIAWYGSADGVRQEPHLVWPEDHAWCLACDVDEEIEFTVGCSTAAEVGLSRALPGAVRRVGYGDSVLTYRHEH